jgi:prevent-host-death family protein
MLQFEPLTIDQMREKITRVPLTEARGQWAELLNQVGYGDERVVLLRHNKPIAVLLSVKEFERLVNCEAYQQFREAVEALGETGGDCAETSHADCQPVTNG